MLDVGRLFFFLIPFVIGTVCTKPLRTVMNLIIQSKILAKEKESKIGVQENACG